jgi:hypothetical protein
MPYYLKHLGTSVQANFFQDQVGADALIYVDGKIVTVVNTIEPNVAAVNTCNITTGSSGPLTDTEHNVTMVNNRPADATDTTPIAIYFISFELVRIMHIFL